MKRIFVAYTTADILRAVRSIKKDKGESATYICAQEAAAARIIHVCIESGLERIEIDPFSEEEREKFLREYIDAIGMISRDSDSVWWWGTDIASRNRFASRIPELFQEFFSVTQAAEQSQCSVIIVLCPSWTIIQSLARAAKKSGYEFWSSFGRWDYWRKYAYAWLHYAGSLAAETITLIGKMWDARDIRRRVITEGSRPQHSYILKTFLYNASAFGAGGTYRDAFFGILPEYLKRQGRNPLLYVRILGDYKKCIENIRLFSLFPIIPFEALIRLSDIVNAIRIVFFPRIHVRKDIVFFDHTVTDIIVNELRRTHNGLTLTTVLHYFATKRLFKSASSDTYIYTYEGNPWERMCIQAVRDFSPQTSIIGYAHTVIPKAAAGMFPSVYERDNMPLSDRVLTTGAVAKELLDRYGAYKAGSVQAACALRFEYLRGVRAFDRNRQKRILVALEGVTPVWQLASYALKELWKETEYEVRFRSHPVLGLCDLAKLLTFNVAQLPPHIHESKNSSLIQDIEWSGAVMYWGSAVGLESLALGRPVIHYQNNSLLNYDPLFDCPSLKWVATDQTSLQSILAEIMALPDSEYENKKIKALEYLKTYLYSVEDSRLYVFLR